MIEKAELQPDDLTRYLLRYLNNSHLTLPHRNVLLGNPSTTKIPTGKSHIRNLRSTFRGYSEYICKGQKSTAEEQLLWSS
jgi:hypothetical protein